MSIRIYKIQQLVQSSTIKSFSPITTLPKYSNNERHHIYYKQYMTYFKNTDSTVDERIMEHMKDKRHERLWVVVSQAVGESKVSAFHQFWKLKYRGQSLLFDAGSSLAFFEAIKTGMEWAFLSLHYKSWHHDTYNDMPAVSPRNMTVKFTHKDCIFLRLSLPPLHTNAPNTRAGRTRAGKALGISSEIFLVIKGVLRLN